jgi:hypothetical protein
MMAQDTQLVRKPQDSLTLTEKIKRGLTEMKVEKQAIKRRERIIFLLDVSGSMDWDVNGRRKIDHLRSVLQEYRENRKICFNSSIIEGEIPEPYGGTDMASAFRYLRSREYKVEQLVLVSDGDPDDPQDAIAQALQLHIPVNIVYIGQRGSTGEKFMQKLSAVTHGNVFTAETDAPAKFNEQLTQGIAGFLTDGKE